MRIVARKGKAPIMAILAGVGLLAATIVRFMRLDRIPLTLCTFRAITGMPCMSCGSTRALGRLAELDLKGAIALQPLFSVLALALFGIGAIDLALYLTRRSALSLECTARAVRWMSIVAVLLVLANWAYLLLRATRS